MRVRFSERVLPPPGDNIGYFFRADEDHPVAFKRSKTPFRLGTIPRDNEERGAERKLLAHRRRGAGLLQDPKNYTGITDMLRKLSPGLESLHLTFYRIDNSYALFSESDLSPNPGPPGRDILSHLATSSCTFPKLRDLAIHNAHVSASDLQILLDHAPALRSLDLREITLQHASRAGNWDTIFTALTTQPRHDSPSGLARMYLDNLFEQPASRPEARRVYLALSLSPPPSSPFSFHDDPTHYQNLVESDILGSTQDWTSQRPGAWGRNSLALGS